MNAESFKDVTQSKAAQGRQLPHQVRCQAQRTPGESGHGCGSIRRRDDEGRRDLKSQNSLSLGVSCRISENRLFPNHCKIIEVKECSRPLTERIITNFWKLFIDNFWNLNNITPVATSFGTQTNKLKTSHPVGLLQPCLWIVWGFFTYLRGV